MDTQDVDGWTLNVNLSVRIKIDIQEVCGWTLNLNLSIMD